LEQTILTAPIAADLAPLGWLARRVAAPPAGRRTHICASATGLSDLIARSSRGGYPVPRGFPADPTEERAPSLVGVTEVVPRGQLVRGKPGLLVRGVGQTAGVWISWVRIVAVRVRV